MALVYNPLEKRVSVQVAGKWFDFAPGQVKLIHNEDIAHIMTSRKAEEGLVGVPDIVGEDKNSPEAKKALEDARTVGINNRIRFLKGIVQNLEVSLRRDLKMKGIEIDADVFASSGELSAMKELATMKDAEKAQENTKIDELKKLRERLK